MSLLTCPFPGSENTSCASRGKAVAPSAASPQLKVPAVLSTWSKPANDNARSEVSSAVIITR